MIIDRQKFFNIQKSFPDVPFNQTEVWLETTGGIENTVFFIDREDNPQLCCWGKVFDRRFIGAHLLIDGLSTNTSNIKYIRDFFQKIVSHGYSIIEVSDIGYYNSNFEIGIRQAGFIRPTLSLSPLTLLVKLQNNFEFHRNWRRNVSKATTNNVNFKVVDKPTIQDCEGFSALFNQLKKRKGLGFNVDPKLLYKLLDSEEYKLFFAIGENNQYLSARVIYITTKLAYDVYAANSDEGIRNGAAYYIQENILYYLKQNGVEAFDYGRIPPSADEMNNIYVAKSYSGGVPMLYNGQWIFNKSRMIDLIYNLLKYYRKQRRY
ncbi:hypothetical protein ACLB9Y_03520 [Chryseobacterium scophthalmum]|uniref:hypothetical protein n=1 Tax=Chryseobacterium scophthalmum TaxID=59733 RepID=UPI00398B9828